MKYVYLPILSSSSPLYLLPCLHCSQSIALPCPIFFLFFFRFLSFPSIRQDMLGTLSEVGNAVFARQTLVGGNYELLRCSSAQLFPGETCDFEPRPDYWVALLWRRLMGPQALVPTLTAARSSVEGASASPSKMPLLSNLRVYQHCTVGSGTGMNGSVTISFSNMADVTVYSLELPTQLAAGRRY